MVRMTVEHLLLGYLYKRSSLLYILTADRGSTTSRGGLFLEDYMSKTFVKFIVQYIYRLHCKIDELEERVVKLEQWQREMKDILEKEYK